MKTAKKIRVESSLKGWDDVDEYLRELNEWQGQLNKATAKYDGKITAVKSEMKEALNGIMDNMNRIASEVHRFCLTHETELDGRSKKLNHGKIAFRKSDELKIPKGFHEQIITSLKNGGRFDLVEIKESIKVQQLKKEKDALEEMGILHLLKTKDNFRIELPENIYDFEKKLKAVK